MPRGSPVPYRTRLRSSRAGWRRAWASARQACCTQAQEIQDQSSPQPRCASAAHNRSAPWARTLQLLRVPHPHIVLHTPSAHPRARHHRLAHSNAGVQWAMQSDQCRWLLARVGRCACRPRVRPNARQSSHAHPYARRSAQRPSKTDRRSSGRRESQRLPQHRCRHQRRRSADHCRGLQTARACAWTRPTGGRHRSNCHRHR